ncbi:hypothetical protein [Streptomyces sp. NPDC002588]|uniref:hypothetical protein n=1 Tax=Streptomyces sp. NPDC002588 TaxID=3154419 RepID=UPI00333159DD
MSETTPNSKGPVQRQMTPEMAASLGLTPTPSDTAPSEPALIPASEVKPEEIGTLALEYRDGRPVIVVSRGKYMPAAIKVVDTSENTVASYSARRSLYSAHPMVEGYDLVNVYNRLNPDNKI